MRPNLFEDAFLIFLHLPDQSRDRHPAGDVIGLRQERALSGHFADVANENIVVAQTLNDLLAGQAFGNRHRMEDLLATDKRVDDIVHAGFGVEKIFAGLDAIASTFHPKRGIHEDRAVDYAFGLERAENVKNSTAFDKNYLVARQWAGLVQAVLGPQERKKARNGQDQQKREKPRDSG